jgi:hypothetical protein
MSDSSSGQSCIICNKQDAKYCARCKSTSYCSQACQKSDWKTHKLLCATFSDFASSKRPSEDHYRALLFDPDKAEPEFIWVRCRWLPEGYQSFDTGPFISEDALEKDIPVQYNPRLERPLLNTLFVTHRDTFLVDGSRPNKSIASITATQPGMYHDWRGPIITYAKAGKGLDPIACKDFDMVDFRHAADYFLSYGYVPLPAQASAERVKGVRINCRGDIKMLGRPPFEAIELLSTGPIFTQHDTSDIADRIEIPILTRRWPPNPRWANGKHEIFEGLSPFDNQDATFLHLCLNPNTKFDPSTGSLGWAWSSMKWQNNVGSVIVVRKDRKPLLPLHMEALARYCHKEVRPILGHSLGECSPEEPISKEGALQLICRPMFVLSWYNFIEEKKEYAVSPYNVDG